MSISEEVLISFSLRKTKNKEAQIFSRFLNKIMYLSDQFDGVLREIGLNPAHRGHDGRTHFVTMAKKYNMDEYALKRIVGHRIDDLTERVYTKRPVEWLISEMDKIV